MPQNFHTKVFKAGLSLIVNTCSMKKCPQIGEWIRKVLYIHIIKYCLAMLYIHVITWMDLQNVMLNGRIQNLNSMTALCGA